MSSHATIHGHRSLHVHVNAWVKVFLLLAIAGLVLYGVLFSTTGLHDTFHHFRHLLAIIPCH